jgi:hypothetical protein
MVTVMCFSDSILAVILAIGLILITGTFGSAQEIAILTDTSGNTEELKTFEVVVNEDGGGDLNYEAGWLSHIYGTPRAIPIQQQNETTLFITLDNISEYQLVDDIATVTLVDGKVVTGKPLKECIFSGETVSGNISVLARLTKSIKFNPEQVRSYLKDEPVIQGDIDEGWPAGFTSKVDIILNSGEVLSLKNVALVYRHHGSDDMWRPPKIWRTWALIGEVPISLDKLADKLDLHQVESIKLIGVSPGSPLNNYLSIKHLNIKLREGESFECILAEGEGIAGNYFVGIGFLGTTENGYVHVPFSAGIPSDEIPSRVIKLSSKLITTWAILKSN